MIRIILMLCLILPLTSCLDHWYPNELSGQVNNGIYSNHTRNGRLPSFDSYNVMVPQHYNQYQTAFLVAKEKIDKNYTYVTFGPAANDLTTYNVMIINKQNHPFKSVIERYFPLFIEQSNKGVERQMEKVHQTETTVNGHPAIYQVYKQFSPDVYNYISQRQPGTVMITHAIYFADYNKYAVIFWIQYRSDSSLNQVNDENVKLVIRERYQPQIKYLNSFNIHEFVPGCCDKIL